MGSMDWQLLDSVVDRMSYIPSAELIEKMNRSHALSDLAIWQTGWHQVCFVLHMDEFCYAACFFSSESMAGQTARRRCFKKGAPLLTTGRNLWLS